MISAGSVEEVIATVNADLEGSAVVFGHGTDNAWDEAVSLVLNVCRLPDHTASLNEKVTLEQAQQIERLLVRRIEERVPLPYLLGKAHFAGYEFLLDKGVVIPRSPIGELIIDQFQPWLKSPPRRIVDLCCGSGCIGIAAALTFPDSELLLIDIDPLAVDLARRNVELHELSARAQVVQADLFAADAATRFDLILTNPPYVDQVDMRCLPAEYGHEPALGLDGGVDGLEVVRRILSAAPTHLSEDGLLICEVGMSAPQLLREYTDVPFIWPDLQHGGEGVFILAAH